MNLESSVAFLANLATALGVPIFVISYVAGALAERRRAEEATYDALDDRYIAWQQLAAANPRLDAGKLLSNSRRQLVDFVPFSIVRLDCGNMRLAVCLTREVGRSRRRECGMHGRPVIDSRSCQLSGC